MVNRSSREDEAMRAAIVAAARRWIGTPYRHQASRLQVGCDCLGFVTGVWRDIYGTAPAYSRTYSADWAEVAGRREPLLDACSRHGSARSDPPTPGDLIVFRFAPHTAAKHLAICATPDTMIHARERHAVREEALTGWWRRRIAGVFAFPLLPEDA